MLCEAVHVHRAHDDAAPEQRLVHLPAGSDLYEDEVGGARHVGEAHGREGLDQVRHAGPVHGERALHVLLIAEGGERADQGEPVHVEGLTDVGDRFHHGLRRHAVSDAQARQAVELGEGVEGDDRQAAVAPVPEGVGVLGVVDVLGVGIIGDDDEVAGHAVEEGLPRSPAVDGPGRVVGVGEEDDPGARCDRLGDRLQVVREVPQRHGTRHPAGRLHHQPIDHERLVGHHRLVARADEGAND